MALTTYDLECVRSGDWWAVEVPQVPGVHTQARRLDQVSAMARDAIALMLDVPPDSFDVTLGGVHLTPEKEPTPLEVQLRQVVSARQQIEAHLGQVAAQTRDMAEQLVGCGFTLRDTGQLLGMSHQRVAQLLRGRR